MTIDQGQAAEANAATHLKGVRIVRVSTVPFFIVSQLKRQIEYLAERGAQVIVVTSDGPELHALQTQPGIECVPIEIPRAISPWRDLLALMRLWRLFQKERVDIAHSTTPKAGLLMALAAFAAGVPIRLHTFTGQPWVTMRGAKRWLALASDRLIGRLNTHCYTDSQSQRKFLIERGVIGDARISVIGAGSLAGVDVHRFDCARFPEAHRRELRQALGIPLEAEILLFVGRITRDKGVRELLEAFGRLKAEGSPAHLIFVGPFDEDSGAGGGIAPHEIEAIRDTHCVGYTGSPESYLSIADIMCLPSYREGFGTVVIEAAAMEVPTIGTNIYGLCDAIEDGKTGLLVQPQDAESLRVGLEKLLSDKALRRSMGSAARQRVEALFAAERVNAGVVEEYRHLLQLKEGR